MIKVSTKTYAKSCVDNIAVNKKEGKKVEWLKMIDIKDHLCVENMSDLTIKAIKCKYNTQRNKLEDTKGMKNYLITAENIFKFKKVLFYQ